MGDFHPQSFTDAFLNEEDFQMTSKRIGIGTQGSVFLCYRKADNHPFVLKRINSNLDKPLLIKHFLREVEVQTRLPHPYFSIFRGFFLTGDSAALVLDYMPKGDLQKFIDKENNITDVACILYGLAVLLDYMHSRKQIHRDLKPANILLDDKCRPRITDFGLARDLDTIVPPTFGIGNTLYNAPELEKIGYSSETYHYSVDVFSMGLVMWHLCVGRYPYIMATQEQRDYAKAQLGRVRICRGTPTEEEIYLWMKENNVIGSIPDCGRRKMGPKLREILCSCIRAKPDERLTASQLEKYLREIDVDDMFEDDSERIDAEVYQAYVDQMQELFYR